MKPVAFALLLAGCAPAASAPAVDGKRLFDMACARCHGEAGLGGLATDGGPAPRRFRDAAFQAARTDEQLRFVIVHGKGGMPAFGETFDASALGALVEHIRGFDPRRSLP